jgi:hypothetical protein
MGDDKEIYSIRIGGSGTREELASDLMKLVTLIIYKVDLDNLTDNDKDNLKISFELEKH